MMAQTTRTRAGMCLLGFVDIAQPQNRNFWGVNRRFQAKFAKSQNMLIIKTTEPIPTKFCTAIKTTKCPSWVVRTHAQQLQDGGRPPSWKSRKIVISRPRFHRFRPNLARRRSSALLSRATVTNFKFEKSKMAAAAILKNRKIAIGAIQKLCHTFWSRPILDPLPRCHTLSHLTVPPTNIMSQ